MRVNDQLTLLSKLFIGVLHDGMSFHSLVADAVNLVICFVQIALIV